MDEYTLYITILLSFAIVYGFIRMFCALAARRKSGETELQMGRGPVRRRVVQRIRIDPPQTTPAATAATADRQGNIFTIADDISSNPQPHRCPDFFYVEPSGEDAARIRAQLEKDDKDLPSYDEVMGMSGTAIALSDSNTGSTNAIGLGASNTSIATTDTTLTVPPYSEIDPAPIMTTPPASSGAATTTITVPTTAAAANGTGSGPSVTAATTTAPSTSRAAATTVIIANSMSNTSV